jgi:hypothetical protein
MPALFRKARLNDPRVVPTVPVEIDWSHPLASRLITMIMPGRGAIDICENMPLGTYSGVTCVPSAIGPVTNFPNAGYLSFPDAPSAWASLATDFSTVALVNPSSLSAGSSIISKTTGNSANPVDWWIGSSYNQFYRGSGSSSDSYAAGSPGITIGTWNTLAWSSNRVGTTRAFVNGLQVISLTSGTQPILDNTGVFRIGQRADAGTQWNGQIASIWLYSRALSSSEMAWQKAEPFAMLSPKIRRRFYFASSSAFSWLSAHL